MDPRVRFVADQLISKLHLTDKKAVDMFLTAEGAALTDFFTAEGRPSLTFYHQSASTGGQLREQP